MNRRHSVQRAAVRFLTLPAEQLVKVAIGIDALVWCALLIAGTMDQPIYTTMTSVMPRTCWIATFAAVSTFEFASIHFCTRSCVIFPLALGIIAVIWWFIATSLLLSTHGIAAGAAGEVVIALLASWQFLHRALEGDDGI